MNYEAITPKKTDKMEKIDGKKLAQINEEANIIYENIKQAIPENSRAISVAIAVAQLLRNLARHIKGNISEVKIREFILDVLDALKADEEITEHDQRKPESAKSQI